MIVHGPGMKVFTEGIGYPFQPIGGRIDVEKKKIVIRSKFLKRLNVCRQRVGGAVGAKHNRIGIGNKRRIEIIKGIVGQALGSVSTAAQQNQVVLALALCTYNNEPPIVGK